MTERKIGALPLLALTTCLALSACGAGGGGGSVASTPTSPTTSPTTTPTTAATNDDLIAPLVSESFANTAAAAAVSYDRNGVPTSQSRSTPTATFAYNATTNTYTVNAAGQSQSFGPAAMTSTGNYRVTSGSTTDDLTLTPTGTSTGGTFRYVGAGFWQRQTQRGDGGIDGSINSFVYGVPTATLVRTGTASYATRVYGAISQYGNLWAISGTGNMIGDLAKGTFQHSGNLEFLSPTTGSTFGGGTFFSTLTVSSTANQLSGGMTIGTSSGSYGGPVSGMFFGPNAEEVGGSFSAADSAGNVATGAFLGRNDPGSSIVALDKLTASTAFEVHYGGQNLGKALTYDPATQNYTIAASQLPHLSNTGPSFYDSFSQFALGPSQKAAVQDDARFIRYDGTVDGRAVTARFYKVGAANGEIQLSYASFYRLDVGPPAGGSGTGVRYALFGVPTPAVLMPKTGTATYAGPIYGIGEYSDGTKAYNVTGQSLFNVDFAAAGSSTGTLNLQLASTTNSTVTTMTVPVNFASSLLSNGYLSKVFFGPNAEELGVSFAFVQDFLAISGVTVAKKQ
ncbi:hypothetical protein H7F51_00285 [Novosphingobium flavum]|uniref:Transferrin-binding protein B C-lobe/N-lobe beta barrel domain-containing protein n=1 Tax=Novosphingobium flavum TaxID=1778672 RepID=A0A7X1FP40_9SPHN|nr:hypothetical protein [Novosphingobium flavum]MBC2663947.1 hypothetical protein [Novosphingobium flavum]